MYVIPQPLHTVSPLRQREASLHNVTPALSLPTTCVVSSQTGQHLVFKGRLPDVWGKRSRMVWGWGVFSCVLVEDKGLDFCLFGMREL